MIWRSKCLRPHPEERALCARLEGWPRVHCCVHPSRRGQRVRAKRGPMINSDAAPQDEVTKLSHQEYALAVDLPVEQFIGLFGLVDAPAVGEEFVDIDAAL